MIEDDLIVFCVECGVFVIVELFDVYFSLWVMCGIGGFMLCMWVVLVIEYFLVGCVCVLVGICLLLGEGWDCVVVNVNIDLMSVII